MAISNKGIGGRKTDKLLMGEKINSKLEINLEIDVNIVSSIAAQLDHLNFGIGMGLDRRKNFYNLYNNNRTFYFQAKNDGNNRINRISYLVKFANH